MKMERRVEVERYGGLGGEESLSGIRLKTCEGRDGRNERREGRVGNGWKDGSFVFIHVHTHIGYCSCFCLFVRDMKR